MALTDSQPTNVLRRTKIILSFAAVIFTISTIVVAALRSKKIQYDHPFMELIPIFPLVSVEFQAHSEYTNLTDPASTRLWQELVHHGHVFVQDATQLGMKPGIPVADEKGERIIVSGFHGLHCLRSIREEMTVLLLGHSFQTTRHPHDLSTHLDHCFDYLRQLLMCDLELTYEAARVDMDGERRATDGWGTVHQCKDWSAINIWMLKNWELEKISSGWHPPAHKKANKSTGDGFNVKRSVNN